MNFKTANDILGSPNFFLDKIFKEISKNRLKVDDFELDHICYRVETIEKYYFLKSELTEIGTLLVESIIGGRKICTFKLREPINYLGRKIHLIELPAPKENSWYAEGYEHVEFVIDSSLDDFQKKYTSIKFDLKGKNKKINPDIRLGLGDLSVKFHLYNLEYVIKELD